jgi:transcriptional antiterminator NusG
MRKVKKIKPQYLFEVGDMVRVIDGPFSSFQGVVEEVRPVRETLRVLITVFGRQTAVELYFIQVKNI